MSSAVQAGEGLSPVARRWTAPLTSRVGPWVLLGGLVVALRLPGTGAPARPDEAGYLLVARHVHRGGAFLYGDLFVDRPPLLLAVFRTADALGGLRGLRVIGLLAAVVLVLSCAAAGQVVGARRGFWVSGLVACALQCTPLLAAPEVDGELLGTPLVALACAVGLAALREPEDRRAVTGTAAAGVLAGSALLVKQNLADAGVLLGALLLWALVQRQVRLRRGALLLTVLALSSAVPLLAAAVWAAHWGGGVGVAWHDLVGFRQASLQVLRALPSPARAERGEALGLAAVLSGVAPLAAAALLVRPRLDRPSGLPLSRVPLAAALLAGTAGAVLGGSYWQHYLLQLVPVTAIGAALVAGAAPRRVVVAGVAAVTASALLTGGTVLAPHGSCADGRGAQQVSRWIAARAVPGDSGATLYGGADALLGSGLRLTYPYLWSLPVRTLDPQLGQLTTAVSGPHRLDWLVVSTPVDAWGSTLEDVWPPGWSGPTPVSRTSADGRSCTAPGRRPPEPGSVGTSPMAHQVPSCTRTASPTWSAWSAPAGQ